MKRRKGRRRKQPNCKTFLEESEAFLSTATLFLLMLGAFALFLHGLLKVLRAGFGL